MSANAKLHDLGENEQAFNLKCLDSSALTKSPIFSYWWGKRELFLLLQLAALLLRIELYWIIFYFVEVGFKVLFLVHFGFCYFIINCENAFALNESWISAKIDYKVSQTSMQRNFSNHFNFVYYENAVSIAISMRSIILLKGL